MFLRAVNLVVVLSTKYPSSALRYGTSRLALGSLESKIHLAMRKLAKNNGVYQSLRDRVSQTTKLVCKPILESRRWRAVVLQACG